MKLHMLRNVGKEDLKTLEASDRKDLTEGNVVDVPQKLGNALLERGLAEAATINAVPDGPGVRAVPNPATLHTAQSLPHQEEPPAADEATREAIANLGRLSSKDKLQKIIDTDGRPAVVDAARKRLSEVS